MPADVFTKKLQRIIGQVRYRPTLASFDNVPSIGTELEKDFEEWQAAKHDDIVLYSPNDKKFLQLTSDFATYINENKEDVEGLVKYIKTIFDKSVTATSIKEVRRIGFRNTQVLACSFKYQELVDLFYRKFYSQDEVLKEISIDNPRDVVFVLDGIKNGFLNHVQIGPVRKDEALKNFRAHFEVSKNILNEETYLFVDVDVFLSEGLSTTNAISKLEVAIKENQRIVNGYVKFLNS